MTNPLFPGYGWTQLFEVTGLGAGESLAGATISAAIVDDLGQTQLVAPVAQADTAPANYATNLVAIRFAAADIVPIAGREGQSVQVRAKVTRGGVTHLYVVGRFPVEKAVVA
jgi:hypothetical protein